ncbi:MAG: methyltransferase [Pseudomonadota bacterium]
MKLDFSLRPASLLSTLGFAALLSSLAQFAQAELDSTTAAKLEEALAADNRPVADKDRDRNRRPLDTLDFFGFSDDMKVLELVPGGGWYTRLLMPTLADEGKLYLAIGTGRAEKLTDVPGFSEAEFLDAGGFGERQPSGRFDIAPFSLSVDDLDLAVTFRNMHNFTKSGRDNMNKAVFDALKSGGHYGVVDHTRRHMQSDSRENRRRMDPVLIIKEVEAAGFEFVDYSDLHYRLDDELRYEVGRATVRGNTDRFTLLFKKP